MCYSIGGKVRYVPGVTHPCVFSYSPPRFVTSAPLPSRGRDRELGGLLMGELLRLTDVAALASVFRQLYGDNCGGHPPAIPPDADEFALVRAFGGLIVGDDRPRVVRRDGQAPEFHIKVGLSRAGMARQLRELLMAELLDLVDEDSLAALFRQLYALAPAQAGRE